MATLTTDTREVRALADALRRAPREASQLVGVAAYECSEIAAAMLREAAPEFQGDLRSSIEGRVVRAVVGGPAGVEAEVSSGVPYALVQDQGRRPGKMPPDAPIRRWVQLKANRSGGGLSERELDSMVYLIRRAIGRKGTRPQNYVDRGVRAAMPHVDARLARLEDQLVALLERG